MAATHKQVLDRLLELKQDKLEITTEITSINRRIKSIPAREAKQLEAKRESLITEQQTCESGILELQGILLTIDHQITRRNQQLSHIRQIACALISSGNANCDPATLITIATNIESQIQSSISEPSADIDIDESLLSDDPDAEIPSISDATY